MVYHKVTNASVNVKLFFSANWHFYDQSKLPEKAATQLHLSLHNVTQDDAVEKVVKIWDKM